MESIQFEHFFYLPLLTHKKMVPPPPPNTISIVAFGCFVFSIIAWCVFEYFASKLFPRVNVSDSFFSKGGARKPALLSYIVTSTVSCILLALFGTHAWFYESSTLNESLESRMYGQSNSMLWLASMMAGYQAWNFLACCVIPDFRNAANFLHHGLTSFLSVLVLNPYATYYVLFFLGVAELTNIPLGVVDLQRNFPSFVPSQKIQNAANATFAIGYGVLRIVVWTFMSSRFMYDSLSVLWNGTTHSVFTSVIFLGGNVAMTGLQYFWGYKIFKFAQKALRRKKKQNAQ